MAKGKSKSKILILGFLILLLLCCVVYFRKETFVNFVDEKNIVINTQANEKEEQEHAEKYIYPSDCVLELGARYGTVSAIINKKLANPKNHLAVEPDSSVWEALEKNKAASGSQFTIVKGIISSKKYSILKDGYASRQVEDTTSKEQHYTLDEIKRLVGNTPFTALVADCEGCIENFIFENQSLLKTLRIILMEEDFPQTCNYTRVKDLFRQNGFKEVLSGFHSVWKKE